MTISEMKINKRQAFTAIEVLVGVLVTAILIIFMQSLFSHTVRSTMRGQDNFDSFKAAGRLFTALRTDLMGAISYQTSEETLLPLAQTSLASATLLSDMLQVSLPTATITYSLIDVAGDKHVQRMSQNADGTTEQRDFGVPRMQAFEVLKINSENVISARNIVKEQLLIRVSVQSEDPRFPSTRINFSSLFFPERRENEWVDWNFLQF